LWSQGHTKGVVNRRHKYEDKYLGINKGTYTREFTVGKRVVKVNRALEFEKGLNLHRNRLVLSKGRGT